MFEVALVTAACGVPQVLQPSELRSAPLRCGCESYRIYLYVGVNDTDDTAIAWHVQAPDYTNDLNAPIAQTLSSGLRAHAARCNYELVDDAPRVLNPTHVFDPMFKALYRPGDVIMWVGSTYHEDFLKGCPSHEAVSCILYWTDSAAPTVPLDNATEIWTYAHGMARQLRSSDLYGGTRKPVRFVPPGYIRHSWMPENISETRHVHRLTLLGAPKGDLREECFHRITSELSSLGRLPVALPGSGDLRLNAEQNTWTDDGWKELTRRLAYTAFVNIHRFAGQPLETIRLSQLLSMGAVVWTMDADSDDLREYEHMLLVEPAMCQQNTTIANDWTSPSTQLLAQGGQALTSWQRDAAERFRARFAPSHVLLRAGVFADSDRSGKAAQC